MDPVAVAHRGELVSLHDDAGRSDVLVVALQRWVFEVLRIVNYAIFEEDDRVLPSQRGAHHEPSILRRRRNVHADAWGVQEKGFPSTSRLTVLGPVEVGLDDHPGL